MNNFSSFKALQQWRSKENCQLSQNPTTMSVQTLILDLIRGLATMRDLDRAQALIHKAGLFSHGLIVARLVNWASLSSHGCLARARSIFERETSMDHPLVCNAMLRAYSDTVFPARAFSVFNRMVRFEIGCDDFALSFALRACAKGMRLSERGEGFSEVENKGFEIHCRVLKLGFCRDKKVEFSLLLFYSKGRNVELARQLFDEMPERKLGSWNVMISGYNRVGDFESADRLFGSMPVKNMVAWNTMLSRLIATRKFREARKLFHEMPERDSVSWNALISGHAREKDFFGALGLFSEMESAGAEPTDVTLVLILGACAKIGSSEIGERIHESLRKNGTRIEGFLGNSLVDMYAKCGKLNSARKVFDELKTRPVSCWNAMIVGLAVHGESIEALELFSKMENRPEEVKPDRVTFIGVLTACSHKGLVKEGQKYFDWMVEKYRIVPDEKHLGCMVDLYSRWGFLEEAYRTVENAPIKMKSVMWRTLLGGCMVHGNVGVAEDCFRKLSESVGALTDADYVLLSNVYAGAGKWEDVERLRNEFSGIGVSKALGFSHCKD